MKNKRVNGRGRPQIYNDEFKWKVVQEVLGGKITQAEAKRKYNIKSNSDRLFEQYASSEPLGVPFWFPIGCRVV